MDAHDNDITGLIIAALPFLTAKVRQFSIIVTELAAGDFIMINIHLAVGLANLLKSRMIV